MTVTFEGCRRLFETLIHAWHSSSLTDVLAMSVFIGWLRSLRISNVVATAKRRLALIVYGRSAASMIVPPPASISKRTGTPRTLLKSNASQKPSRSRRWATTYLICGFSVFTTVTDL